MVWDFIYTQLPFSDQVVLLEVAWPELFILSAAQWGFTIDESKENSLFICYL